LETLDKIRKHEIEQETIATAEKKKVQKMKPDDETSGGSLSKIAFGRKLQELSAVEECR
jgi:hypothetical protein